MDFFDLLIIYLACGAPFAVYSLVSSDYHGPHSYLRPFFVLFFWPIVAGSILLRSDAFRGLYDSDRAEMVVREFEISEFRRRREAELMRRDPEFRVFAFREAFDRFVGLALEIRNADREPVESIRELGRISGRAPLTTAERALQRRAIGRLVAHRDLAREDLSRNFSFDRAAMAELERLIGDRHRAVANDVQPVDRRSEKERISLDRAA